MLQQHEPDSVHLHEDPLQGEGLRLFKQLLCPLREAAHLNAKNKIHVDFGVLCPASKKGDTCDDKRHSMGTNRNML